MRSYDDLSDDEELQLSCIAREKSKVDRTLSHSSADLNLNYEGIIQLIKNYPVIDEYKQRYVAIRTLQHKVNSLKKHGVECIFQLPEVQRKSQETRRTPEVKEKIRNTCRERYGGDSPLHSGTTSRKKYEETMIEKYGVPNAFCKGELRDKAEERFYESHGMSIARYGQLKGTEVTKERYGVSYYFQSPDANKKILENIRARGFGGPNSVHYGEETARIISSREELERFILSVDEDRRTRSELSSVLGMSTSQFNYYARTYELRHLLKKNGGMSQAEKSIGDIIMSWGVKVVRRTRKIIPPYEIDIYLPEYKVGIEYNGDYWHKGKDDYHKMKTDMCAEVGVDLIHVQEKDYNNDANGIISKIFNYIGLDEKYSLVISNDEVESEDIMEFRDIEVESDLHNFRTEVGVVHNSADLSQILSSRGFTTKYTSMDRSPDGYNSLRSAINDHRITLLPNCDLLYNELSELERDNQTGRYDHNPGGSKDCSDSLGGALLNALQYKDEFLFFNPDDFDYEVINDSDDLQESLRSAMIKELMSVGSMSANKIGSLFHHPTDNSPEGDDINDSEYNDYSLGTDDNILLL